MKIPSTGSSRGTGEEIRCPSCSRLLVLRSGPAITAHFAHRPRQSCRRRGGRSEASPIRLEQLTLFDLETVAAAAPRPRPDRYEPIGASPVIESSPARRRRRRRRAWLPRLIRRLRAWAR